MSFQHLSVTELEQMLAEGESPAVLDIRDPASFSAGHIEGAVHLTNDNVQQCLQSYSEQDTLVVCCYHGNSSQPVAAWLAEQGFNRVYSLDGGYSAWALRHP